MLKKLMNEVIKGLYNDNPKVFELNLPEDFENSPRRVVLNGLEGGTKRSCLMKAFSHGFNASNRSSNQRWTVLHAAAYYNQRHVVQYLVKRTNVPMNAKSLNGSTALHYAVRNANVSIVQLLVCNGADKSICDDSGRTPADVAFICCPNSACEKLLASTGNPYSNDSLMYPSFLDLR